MTRNYYFNGKFRFPLRSRLEVYEFDLEMREDERRQECVRKRNFVSFMRNAMFKNFNFFQVAFFEGLIRRNEIGILGPIRTRVLIGLLDPLLSLQIVPRTFMSTRIKNSAISLMRAAYSDSCYLVCISYLLNNLQDIFIPDLVVGSLNIKLFSHLISVVGRYEGNG